MLRLGDQKRSTLSTGPGAVLGADREVGGATGVVAGELGGCRLLEPELVTGPSELPADVGGACWVVSSSVMAGSVVTGPGSGSELEGPGSPGRALGAIGEDGAVA